MAPSGLPFLYQTRTILRSSRALVTSSPPLCRSRICSLSQSRPASSASPKGFFQEKAKEVRSDGDGSTNATTMTGEEKKIFKKIFESLAKSSDGITEEEPTKRKDDVDTDHKRILAIFSRSMRDYHAEQQRKSASGNESAAPGHKSRFKDYIARYPRELRWGARKAAEAAFRDRTEAASGVISAKDADASAGPMLSLKPVSASQQRDVNESSGLAINSETPAFMQPALLSELHDIEEAFVRLPFARDIAIDDDDEAASQAEVTDEFDRLVDSVAEQEMAKIAQSFDESIRDAAAHHKALDSVIWEVCEGCIFPMLDDLDTRSYSTLQTSGNLQAAAQTASDGLDPEIDEAQTPSNTIQDDQGTPKTWALKRLPAYIPPLSIISRLYPAALLLALRLYAKHYPVSPYALAILPHVRAQGPKNYVLGGTTPFYNTLIKLQWEVYSNLREISGLLAEMEKGGIELDVETYEILVAIGEARWADIDRSDDEKVPMGCRKKSWWESSAQTKWFRKVCVEWKQMIATRLREQGEVVSEREYGRGISPHFEKGGQRGHVVWIG